VAEPAKKFYSFAVYSAKLFFIMRTKDFDEQEILQKAIKLFWQKGYNGTSMQDLIDGLGIGRSSIYHAFGDKHTLYLKALERYQQDGTQRLVDTINAGPTIQDAIRNLLKTNNSDRALCGIPEGCFKVNAGVEVAVDDEEILKLLREDDVIIEKALYTAIKQQQDSGKLSAAKDPRALARFVCNTMAGIRAYAKTKKDEVFFNDIINTALLVFD
jgi:TetR/AcrR family transcriptional repressor of nem operon